MRRILPAEAGRVSGSGGWRGGAVGLSAARTHVVSRLLLGALAVAVSTAAPTQAQTHARVEGSSPLWASTVAASGAPIPIQSTGSARSVAEAAAFSAILPGAGQYRLGQSRAWAYLAVEVAAWGFYVDRRRAGNAGRDRYRDFAWERGRLQGSTRIDGSFDYYETMSKWIRSGAFDADAGAAGIQPEMDPTAFNGSIWALADQIYQPGPGAPPGDPRLEQALAYYRQRAYGDDFLWDWTGTGTARTEYAELISDSDARFRQATNALGVVFANHIVSAVDAFLSARGLTSPLTARVRPWREAPLGSWSAVLTVTTR